MNSKTSEIDESWHDFVKKADNQNLSKYLKILSDKFNDSDKIILSYCD